MEIGQGIEQGIVSNLTDAVMGTTDTCTGSSECIKSTKKKTCRGRNTKGCFWNR